MIHIGLTGSIGMGKSTTARMFAEEGVPVFDADAVVHDLYRPGAAGARAIGEFFPDALRADGGVDRAALSARLRDPHAMAVIEGAIHPLVAEARAHFLDRAAAQGAVAVVFDIPLLFETGLNGAMDVTVVVTAPDEVQRGRVLSREGMTFERFEEILKRQVPDEEKRARADVVIDTGRGLEAARGQVRDLLRRIAKGDFKARITQGR